MGGLDSLVKPENDSIEKIVVMKILITIMLMSMFASFSWAGELTYREAIKDTLSQSARVRVKMEDINISDASYRQVFAGLYPEITANSRVEKYENLDKRNEQGINTISGEVIGGGVSAWRSSAYLWGQYYLSHWYKKRHEANYYERLKDMSVHDCDAEIKKLLKEVTDTFSALSEGRIKIRYASEIVKRLQEVLHLKKQSYQHGQIAYEEVLKTEADAVAMEKDLAALRKEFKENLDRLYSYTGKAYSDDVAVERLVSSGSMQISDFRQLIENTPEYKARAKELEALKYKEKAANNNFWPDISLYGRYDYYGSNTNGLNDALRDIRETALTGGILISLPIFDGGVRKWERRKNMYEVRKREESVKAVIEEKGRDIRTLHTGYTELSRSLKHYKKISDQYAKMLDISKKAHGLGERSMIDIIETEKEALTVERDLKVTEHALAVYEKRLALEMDYRNFITEYYGDSACKH